MRIEVSDINLWIIQSTFSPHCMQNTLFWSRYINYINTSCDRAIWSLVCSKIAPRVADLLAMITTMQLLQIWHRFKHHSMWKVMQLFERYKIIYSCDREPILLKKSPDLAPMVNRFVSPCKHDVNPHGLSQIKAIFTIFFDG